MGFGEAVRLFFRNYAKFEGRSRRSEFWWPQLFLILGGLSRSALLSADLCTALGDLSAPCWAASIYDRLRALFSRDHYPDASRSAFVALHDTDKKRLVAADWLHSSVWRTGAPGLLLP